MICSHCGQRIPDKSKFCNYCGSVQETQRPQYQRVCPKCKRRFHGENTFCNKCGQELVDAADYMQKRKTKLRNASVTIVFAVLLLLILFLIGWLGGFIDW